MESQNPNDQAERIVGNLQKYFKVVGSHRVHPWYAWGVLGVFFGITLTTVYVAQLRNLNLVSSEAATVPLKTIMLIASGGTFPVRTIIDLVIASDTRPEKLWIYDSEFDGLITQAQTSQAVLTQGTFYGKPRQPLSPDDVLEEMRESGHLRILVSFPNGDVFISSPVVDAVATVDLTKPIFNITKTKTTYQLKFTFETQSGNRSRIPDSDILVTCFDSSINTGGLVFENDPDDDHYYDFIDNFFNDEGCLRTPDNKLSVPGPAPSYFDMEIVNPNDPDFDFWIDGIIPAEVPGTFEFVLYDSEKLFHSKYGYLYDRYEATGDQSALDEYNRQIFLFAFNDLKEIIFTPNAGSTGTGGASGSTTKPPLTELSRPVLHDGKHLSAYVTPPSTPAPHKTAYGAHIGDIVLKNIAETSITSYTEKPGRVKIPYFYLTLSTSDGSPIPELPVRVFVQTPDGKRWSDKFKCVVNTTAKNLCTARIKRRVMLEPGKVKILGVVIDPEKLATGKIVKVKVTKDLDFPYSYIEKTNRHEVTKKDFYIGQNYIPLIFPDLKK